VFLRLQSVLRKAAAEALTKDAAHRYQQSGMLFTCGKLTCCDEPRWEYSRFQMTGRQRIFWV